MPYIQFMVFSVRASSHLVTHYVQHRDHPIVVFALVRFMMITNVFFDSSAHS